MLELGPLWQRPQYEGFLEWLVELPILPEFAHSLNPGSSQNDTTPFLAPDVVAEIRNNEDSEGFEIVTTLDYIEGFIQWSKNQPFSFRLWARRFAAPVFLEALLKHSALWQEIVLVDLPPALLQRLSQFDSYLQHLGKIALIYQYTNYFRTKELFQYSVASHLTDLALVRVHIHPASHRQIPWSQLTRYCEIDCSWWHPGSK
jgi:hypothetical protein